MPNTYSQIYIHLVFAVAHRERLLSNSFKDDVCKYISGVVQNKGHKLLRINSMPDHLHILVGLNPNQSISELVKSIKTSSNEFINSKKYVRGRFSWQEGYGAFSYSKSQISQVANYIDAQEKHHKGTSFKEEYIKILKSFNIEFDNKYLFNFFEE